MIIVLLMSFVILISLYYIIREKFVSNTRHREAHQQKSVVDQSKSRDRSNKVDQLSNSTYSPWVLTIECPILVFMSKLFVV